MNTKLLKTEEEYKKALAEAEKLVEMDPLPETKEADRLELLCLLIENYERKHYVFDNVSAKDAIEYAIEQKGLKKSDLIQYFGSQSRVSDFFRGARGLSIGIIKKIHDGLGIPYDVLLKT
ncbi:MAG: hypothetical protein WC637_03995 [Victivallales bacterium]|jgi:HTH-type transcriptional regulator/antitoxin HigA